MSMTHGTNGAKANEDPPRPPSSHGSSTGSSGSSKHVKCIGRYVITGSLGKGNFARVESAVHTLTRAKVRKCHDGLCQKQFHVFYVFYFGL